MRVESRMLDLLGEATTEVDWGERIAFHEKELHRLQTQTPTAGNATERKASIAKHKAALMAAYAGRLPTKDEVAAAVDRLGEMPIGEAGAYRPHFGDPGPRGLRKGERDYFEASLKQERLSSLIRKLVNSGDDDKARTEALALCAEITAILK